MTIVRLKWADTALRLMPDFSSPELVRPLRADDLTGEVTVKTPDLHGPSLIDRSVLTYDHTDGSLSTVDGSGTGRHRSAVAGPADDRVLVAENLEAGTSAQRSEVLIP